MRRRWVRPLTLVPLLLVALASCSSEVDGQAVVVAGRVSATSTTVTTATTVPPASTTVVPATTRQAGPTAPARPPTAAAPRPRSVADQPWVPFATVGGIVLHHPSSRMERVGFHEANHDGAREMEPLPSAVAAVTLESRGRPTGARTAADVVADPAVEIRAPVTGTVRVAGSTPCTATTPTPTSSSNPISTPAGRSRRFTSGVYE